MEIPAYDPRATWTQAMSYMITARGACHLQGGYSAPISFCAGYGEFPGVKSEGAALVARNAAYHNTAYDVLGVCAFGGFSVTLDEYANMLNDVTGLEMKTSDLEKVSRRVLTLERLFNLLAASRRTMAAGPVLRGPLPSRRPVVYGSGLRAMRSETSRSAGRARACVAALTRLGLDAVLPAEEVERMTGITLARTVPSARKGAA
jgi:aldehyde:ferredoxin oxidoreductase